jgi:hypothetical protein
VIVTVAIEGLHPHYQKLLRQQLIRALPELKETVEINMID